jgi:fibronectin type 3 domain-containing protein
MTWTANTSALTYRVYQAPSASGTFTPSSLSILSATGATVSGLTANTTYYLRVVAVDSSSNPSSPSATVAGVTTL